MLEILYTIWDFIGKIGNQASTLGIVFTIIQLLRIKKISETTKAVALETQNRLLKVTSIDDLSKKIECVKQIRNDIIQLDFESARLKFESVREYLIEFKEVNFKQNYCAKTEIQTCIMLVGDSVRTLNKNISGTNQKICDSLIQNQDRTLEILIGIKAKLKT